MNTLSLHFEHTIENWDEALPLSSSPEIHENSKEAWLTPNSNYDLALMRGFAEDMIRISRMQGDDGTAREWEHHLGKFEPLAVNENGVLMLSPDESPYCSHRHHSHCMAIYPLKTMEYTSEENRRIIDSTIADLEHHGIGEWCGYSVGWMAQLYIAKGDGEKACRMLRDFFTYNCTSNGFHVNGDYQEKTAFNNKCRLFTLEGNFLATDALQDMLLYSEWGKLKAFPAVPQDWKEIAFENFRAFGGVLVSGKQENGRILYLKCEATADCDFTIENDLSHLQPDRFLSNGNDIHLNKGEVLIFS